MFKTLLLASSVLILSDGQKLETDISLKNPTRIIFEDDRPTKLIFNEADQNAPDIAAVLGTKGDIFISVERGLSGQSISGFMTTESGKTYPVKLNIRPMDTTQVTIASAELRRQAEKAKAAPKAEPELKTVEWTHKNSYSASLGELIKALYFHQAPEGFREVSARRKYDIVKDNITARAHKRFLAGNLEAITYVVTPNHDYSAYLPNHLDAFPKYLALSYSGEHLESGKPVYVYLVRKRATGVKR
ncbi:MAG: TraK domain-containing protein [Maricaulaceae bacterium]